MKLATDYNEKEHKSMSMEIVSQYGVYQGIPNGKEDGYNLQRAPVTYTALETALEGLHNYAKAIPNEVFLLINETYEFIVKGTRWDKETKTYHYAPDAEGQDVSFIFEEHTHDET